MLKVVLALVGILLIGLPLGSQLINLGLVQATDETLRTSSSYESENFDGEAHGTTGLDIEFIDEYHGYGSEMYCDQRIVDGPYGDHFKVLIMRDAQAGANTWSVHYLNTPLFVGCIEFSLWFSSGSSCSNPYYHYIKFRDKSDTIAFQLRFDLYSNKVYYHSGSSWHLIATLTEDEWYRYKIDFNINSHTYNLEISNESSEDRIKSIFDRPYDNIVPVEEIYLATTVDQYHGNTRWDDFEFYKDEYVDILRPNQNVQNQWDQSSEAYIDENIEEPDAGDSQVNAHSGNSEYETDIFGMDTISLERKVAAITVYLLCSCEITGGGWAEIDVYYRIGSGGAWSTLQKVEDPVSYEWIALRWEGLNLDKDDIDDLQIRLSADIEASQFGGWVSVDTMYVEIEHIPEKIGVCFWASDAGTTAGNYAYHEEIAAHVNSYRSVLQAEGYTKIWMIKDVSDSQLDDKFDEVREFEFDSDLIFFYFWGHGNVDGSHSFAKLNCYTDSRRCDIYSDDLITELSTFDTIRIGYLVESCKSGYFVEDLDDNPYLAISTSDCSHVSRYDAFHEGRFSNHFWDAISGGSNAYQAYSDAKSWNEFYASLFVIIFMIYMYWPLQYPLYDNNLYDQTGYMFFT